MFHFVSREDSIPKHLLSGWRRSAEAQSEVSRAILRIPLRGEWARSRLDDVAECAGVSLIRQEIEDISDCRLERRKDVHLQDAVQRGSARRHLKLSMRHSRSFSPQIELELAGGALDKVAEGDLNNIVGAEMDGSRVGECKSTQAQLVAGFIDREFGLNL